MKMRAPAIPLINVDPFFNVWAMADTINEDVTRHWSDEPHPITGTVTLGEKTYCFLGKCETAEAMKQTALDIDVLSTTAVLEADGISVTAVFTTPNMLDDLKVLSRPVSYLQVSVKKGGVPVDANIALHIDYRFCARNAEASEVVYEDVTCEGLSCGRIGRTEQNPLHESGDQIPIDWGYFYGAVEGGKTAAHPTGMTIEKSASNALFLLAYNDILSLEYYGVRLPGYWHKENGDIRAIISAANREYAEIMAKCRSFSDDLLAKAEASGGEEYRELLTLAYRQTVGAHKLLCDENGDILFISKECYSGGFAATADVSYPSTPLYLLYCPELVNGMMRPIFKYARSAAWPYEFAPHDAGQFPLVNGQRYANGTDFDGQMPVEECGNMLVMMAATAIASNDFAFAASQWDLLEQWCGYLAKQGMDPENQLCTDDFAGHLAHNCNLSVKAIMGIASFAILCKKLGKTEEAEEWMAKARAMAVTWEETAANGDGTYRLAFDRPDTYSMKYNMLWDVLFCTGIFPEELISSEFASYTARRANEYGMPLDNRADYTKSDWILWCASIPDDDAFFADMVHRVWLAYHESPSRKPMTDWYDTKTAKQIGFQNRTVQGGLFVKILKDSGLCKA